MAKPPFGKRALASAFEDARQPIYLLDEPRRLIYCNSACLAWLAAAEADVIGKSCHYHSLPTGPHDVVSGLCPPPRESPSTGPWRGTVWVARPTALSRRQAQFANWSVGGVLADAVTLALVAEHDDASSGPTIDAVPSRDAAVLHQQLLDFRATEFVPPGLDVLMGSSPIARRIRAQVQLAAGRAVATVVMGPPGSGRERLARSIYEHRSTGSSARLAAVPCPCADPELLQQAVDSLLVVPRDQDRRCSPALLLLDADQLSGAAQTGLAQLLDHAAGAFTTIATTRAVLDSLPDFSRELACRLGELTIELPPLTQRLTDLPLLIQAAVEYWNQRRKRSVGGVDPAAMDLLLNHPWQRNADELLEVVASAHEHCRGTMIGGADLPEIIRLTLDAELYRRRSLPTLQLDAYLANIERELIARALALTAGNRAQAARLLGVSRARLVRHLGQLDD